MPARRPGRSGDAMTNSIGSCYSLLLGVSRVVVRTLQETRESATSRRKTIGNALGIALLLVTGCSEPDVLVGAIECSRPGGGQVPSPRPNFAQWSTGFESGFCDYTSRWGGYCYTASAAAMGEGGAGGEGAGGGSNEPASFEIVTSPVRSGRRSAAFTVRTELGGRQSRCFVDGELPTDARYGAWFYLPSDVESVGVNWNLFHFLGDRPNTDDDGLWDVSLQTTDTEPLHLYVRDFLEGAAVVKVGTERVPVPIATWFHVEFRWRRATDETGTVALYQDGQLLWTETNRITDHAERSQWYVGNLADLMLPPEASTLYVDDVTIRPSP
jgi:hypothetical protein